MIFLTNPGGDMSHRARDKKGRFKKAPKRKPSRRKKPAARRKASPNPRRKTVAKHRARYTSGPKKGQFKPKGRSSSSGGSKRKKAAPARRRSYRRNPRRLTAKGLVKDLTDGAIGAGQVLVGKAIVRTVPQQFGLPSEGPMGYAVQAALAIVAGQLAGQFMSRQAAQYILIGGFTAPVEEAIVAANVPLLSPALSSYPALSAYPSALTDPSGVLALAAYPSSSYDVDGYA